MASLAVGCGDDDGEGANETSTSAAGGPNATDTSRPSGGDPGENPAGTVYEGETEEDDPCVTSLSLQGVDVVDGGAGAASGDIEVDTAFAEEGDEALDLVFSTYDLGSGSEGGLQAPEGDPEAPDGELVYVISLTGAIEEGAMYVEAAAEVTGDGEVAEQSLWFGSEQIQPLALTTVVIEQMTDDQVCGLISAADTTELQDSPVVSGRFAVDRLPE